MIVRLEPITAIVVAVLLGWAWNTATAPGLSVRCRSSTRVKPSWCRAPVPMCCSQPSEPCLLARPALGFTHHGPALPSGAFSFLPP